MKIKIFLISIIGSVLFTNISNASLIPTELSKVDYIDWYFVSEYLKCEKCKSTDGIDIKNLYDYQIPVGKIASKIIECETEPTGQKLIYSETRNLSVAMQ